MATTTEMASAAIVLHEAGHPTDLISDLLQRPLRTIQRWIKDGRPEHNPGPTEVVVDRLVDTWGELNPTQALQAQSLRNFAVMADLGTAAGSGAAMQAGVQSNTQLALALKELGQVSAFEDLRDLLLADDG